MKLLKTTVCGTLESSDILVTVAPADTITIELESKVEKQFGQSIRASVLEVSKKMGIEGANITLIDHGALDCTIRARVETAFKRSLKVQEATQ